jgi:1-acyl-sn-glycerol-3-phosphate acyltransferase
VKLRGYAAVATVSVGLLVADIVQRCVIAPWVRLRPTRRIAVLGRWQHLLARFVLSSAARVGGATIPQPPVKIPAEAGHLILMNHQSLFDIPLVVRTVDRGYPRIVTRERYSRSIPLISHMTRLYQYPVVDPRANRDELRQTLEALEETGREADVPIVVFPEGTRTADGEIRRFKIAGLVHLLRARPWTVHLLVVDGFWRAARFADLTSGCADIHGRLAYAGTIDWPDPEADPKPMVDEAHRRMAAALSDMRVPAALS